MKFLVVLSCLLAIVAVDSSTVNSSTVTFHLHTQETGATYQQLYINDTDTLASSNFNASKKTRIITHGWQNSCEDDAVVTVRDAYLENGDYNVMVVDWSVIAAQSYIIASGQVSNIAGYVASFIDFLEENGMDLSNLIVVGHSLGAHIVGLAAYQATNEVGYAIGLDPAGPLFTSVSNTSRIASFDAKVVHGIHTNAGLLGISFSIGDADFWPNGGSDQPGCTTSDYGACSHGRSYEFLAESINSETGFHALSCTSYESYEAGNCSGNNVVLMGGDIPDSSASGSYYLDTAATSPYCLG